MFYDHAARNAGLDALHGDNHATTMPTAYDLALLTNDPRLAAPVEVSGPGYARLAARPNSNVTWDAAVTSVKWSKLQTFPASTGAWTTARFWGLYVAGVLFEFGPLAAPINVTGAGPGPAIRIPLRFNERLVS